MFANIARVWQENWRRREIEKDCNSIVRSFVIVTLLRSNNSVPLFGSDPSLPSYNSVLTDDLAERSVTDARKKIAYCNSFHQFWKSWWKYWLNTLAECRGRTRTYASIPKVSNISLELFKLHRKSYICKNYHNIRWRTENHINTLRDYLRTISRFRDNHWMLAISCSIPKIWSSSWRK